MLTQNSEAGNELLHSVSGFSSMNAFMPIVPVMRETSAQLLMPSESSDSCPHCGSGADTPANRQVACNENYHGASRMCGTIMMISDKLNAVAWVGAVVVYANFRSEQRDHAARIASTYASSMNCTYLAAIARP